MKLNDIATALLQWKKSTFGNLPSLIRAMEETIAQAQSMCSQVSGPELFYWLEHEKQYRQAHQMLMQCNETYWKQRSRVQWLQEGELNTIAY